MTTIQNDMLSILRKEAQAILDIPGQRRHDRAVELIVEHVNRRGGKLITSGMGKPGR